MFADINLAVAEVAEKLGFGSNIINMVNLDDNVGLPKNRRNAREITADLKKKDLRYIILSEVGWVSCGRKHCKPDIGEKYKDYDFTVIRVFLMRFQWII